MNYRTELMEKILTSEQAQLFIDKMSPIYGRAYTFLWLLQSIGMVLDDLMTYPEEITKQVTPQTASWTLDFWEKEYGIATDPTKTVKERQQILTKIIKANTRNNPKTLADLITNSTGYATEIRENVSKNKFSVKVYGYLADNTEIKKIIDRRKPAHLIYEIIMSEVLSSEVPMYNSAVGYVNNENLGNVEVIN